MLLFICLFIISFLFTLNDLHEVGFAVGVQFMIFVAEMILTFIPSAFVPKFKNSEVLDMIVRVISIVAGNYYIVKHFSDGSDFPHFSVVILFSMLSFLVLAVSLVRKP